MAKHNQSSVRVVLEKLKNDGLIEKIEHNDNLCFALTDSGRRVLLGAYLEKKYLEKEREKLTGILRTASVEDKDCWDKIFYLIVVSVPENKRWIRFQIKEYLYDLGFRPWQQSIWISPRSFKKAVEELERRKWQKYVSLIKANSLIEADRESRWLYNLWRLDQLREKYLALIKEADQVSQKISFDTLGHIKLINWEKELLQNLNNDPFFPDNFYNIGPLREKAVNIFLELATKTIL